MGFVSLITIAAYRACIERLPSSPSYVLANYDSGQDTTIAPPGGGLRRLSYRAAHGSWDELRVW